MSLLLLLLLLLVKSGTSEDIKDLNLQDFLQLIKATIQFRPRDVKAEDVKFFLFSRNESWNEEIDNQTDLNPNKTTKIIIHGYIDNHRRSWYKNLTEEYLKKGDFNIIHVDWGRVAQSSYISSAQNTKLVGKYLADFLAKNFEQLDNIHLIGHSLGAHVAGFAAKEMKKSGKKLHRITALDPAGPYFREFGKMNRLTSDDAEIVDVIHTDGGFYGLFQPIGTFDIYINGGTRIQPDCGINVKNTSVGEFFDDTYCSHTRSYIHFIDLINKKKISCPKCINFLAYLAGFCNSKREKYVFGVEDINEAMTGVCFVKM